MIIGEQHGTISTQSHTLILIKCDFSADEPHENSNAGRKLANLTTKFWLEFVHTETKIRKSNNEISAIVILKLRLHERFLLVLVMNFFQILLHHQRVMKIASVATLELLTQQLKKS